MNIGPNRSSKVTDEFQRLDALKLLPPASELMMYQEAKSPAEGLVSLWKEWLREAPSSRRSRAARIHSGLHAAVANGAELTFEIPGRSREISERWLGKRAYWWPSGVPAASSVGIVASRLKRDPDFKTPVLRALRISMAAINSCEQVLASEGTSLCDYVDRCARTLRIPCLHISTATDRTGSQTWLKELLRHSALTNGSRLLVSTVETHPENDASIKSDSVAETLAEIPIRDRVLALMSQRLFVLSLRRNGNWWKLFQAGITDGLWQPGAARVATGRGLCSDKVASELQSQGAVCWYLGVEQERPASSDTQDDSVSPDDPVEESGNPSDQAVAESSLISEFAQSGRASQWLIHWTRTPQNEWAGESRNEFLDEMVQGETKHERTAFGTLQRIIDERLIRATPGNTRAGLDVVCFSETPLAELVTQRVFRRHRGRWDFEHYGIGIRHNTVRAMGGRPVIYGDEAKWQALPEGERPWFQPQSSETANGGKAIDWTAENEWRVTSDVRLSEVPEDFLFAFCATEAEAASLRSQYNWRVVSIERLKQTLLDSEKLGE